MDEQSALARFHERLAEFRGAIDRDFIASQEAANFIGQMEMTEPETLRLALRARAVDSVRITLTREERRARARIMTRVSQGVFAKAVKGFEETGDTGLFAAYFVIDADGLRRQFGKMRGIDCRYQQGLYEHEGKVSLARAAFLQAVERKAGRKRIENVMSEGEAEKLLYSFIGDHFRPTPTA